MKITDTAIVRAIQEAVDAAVERGVNVTVKIEEKAGFFSDDKNTLTITAQRRRVRKAKPVASS